MFIQFNPYSKYGSTPESVFHTLIEGKVLVTRSPCVHPGDIRVLKAVNPPQLKDYVNVIVFSSQGERPEQNKMGSGDLDGDIYWITWKKEFIEPYQEQPPEEKREIKDEIFDEEGFEIYKSYSSTLTDDIQREHCIKNLIEYIQNDVLGQVANLH